MLGLRLGGLVKNWTIVGFEVKCFLRPIRAFLEKGENINLVLCGCSGCWFFEDKDLELVRFGILIVV